MLDGEFVGPVSGAIYHARDVSFSGPNEGAQPLAQFEFEEVDLRNGPMVHFRLKACYLPANINSWVIWIRMVIGLSLVVPT